MTAFVRGPDRSWMEDAHAGRGVPRPVGPAADDDEAKRQELMEQLDRDENLAGYRRPGLLGCYLRGRWLHAQLMPSGPPFDPDEALASYLEEAVDHGCPELATAAAKELEDQESDAASRHAGDSRTAKAAADDPDRAHVGPVYWDRPDHVGVGRLRWGGEDWRMVDYQADLTLHQGLLDQLANPPEDPSRPAQEHRQCLLLHVAAGILWSDKATEPDPQAVQDLALRLRTEMYSQAAIAAAALGPPPPAMGQAEADLRTFIHDLVHRDHDKDYRSLAAFPPAEAEHVAFHILRVSHRGGYTGESVYGWHFDEGTSPHVWLLVHRGHMRLLVPPKGPGASPIRRAPDPRSGFTELFAAGWEAHLLAGSGDPPSITARSLEACPRCPVPGATYTWRTGFEANAFGRAPLPVGKIGADPVRPVQMTDLPERKVTDSELRAWLTGTETGQDQSQTFEECLLHGCDFLEVWGGVGRTTHAVAHRGGRALIVGLAWGHDLGEAEQRNFLYALQRRVRPKHAWFAFPCTAFCCWVRLNRAQGCDLDARRREGLRHLRTTLAAVQLQVQLNLHATMENPLSSMAWKEPAMAKETSLPHWHAVRLDQCAMGLTGPGGGLHLKPTSIRTTCPLMAAAMSKRCSGDHPHETVEGSATGLSAMYPPKLALAIASVVVPTKATKVGGGGSLTNSLAMSARRTRPVRTRRLVSTWKP
jgi:hypothetical protein